jgi:hypothetical protein
VNLNTSFNSGYSNFRLDLLFRLREFLCVFIQFFQASDKIETQITCIHSSFGGLEVVCWPLVPKFVGSHPAKAVGFLKTKILSTPSFGGEVKLSVPCRSFTACKISLNVMCKSAFRQNYRTFLAHSSTFRRWMLSRGDTHGDAWWRKLERLTKIAQ